ncbi:M48 family metallopeptidase [Clostridium sp. DJ247]|uniref:M48 family metallopeptidase n=1 Tax=Clostridium sp. DJ247 TaxID=2726188 RepID=UPI001629ABAC|nr:SprT family zinc-dependent metalloprotease [Clostridium sp. DJ247]MBC2580185.1 M48 family metallopeptidase [Clostridium sp. DJ247]
MTIDNNVINFKYKIVREKRKTISIRITDKGEVLITSPFNVSEETIKTILKKKEKWIISKVQLFTNRLSNYKEKEFVNGEKFLYLGKELQLEFCIRHSKKVYTDIQEGKLKVYVNNYEKNHQEIRNSIIDFYRKKAMDILSERTKIYSELIEVRPKKIIIKDQKTIWGSCSSKGNLNYNYRIIMAPMEIIDYIVVHELCHLVHMNHSKEYWNTVKLVLLDYERRRQWLKDNGYLLKL